MIVLPLDNGYVVFPTTPFEELDIMKNDFAERHEVRYATVVAEAGMTEELGLDLIIESKG